MTYIPTKKELQLALQVHDMERGDIEESIYWFAHNQGMNNLKSRTKFSPTESAPTGLAINGVKILTRIYGGKK